MTTPAMNIADLGGLAGSGAGYVGLGGSKDRPLLTIYFGVSSDHPTRAQAEEIARRILQHPEIFGGAV